jgi:hypothetical protein
MQQLRQSKLASAQKEIARQNKYLREHLRAQEEVALEKVTQKCAKLKISSWATAVASRRTITLIIDEGALAEAEKLDGCYVLKTDLKKQAASKETVHARYKDLARVEWAFRTSKTVQLEMRPIYVRRADRTRGHALVVKLAYRIAQELAERWRGIDLTVQEGIHELASLCGTEIVVNRTPRCNKIPEPRKALRELLKAAKVRLPEALPCRGVRVATRKKLTDNRKTR